MKNTLRFEKLFQLDQLHRAGIQRIDWMVSTGLLLLLLALDIYPFGFSAGDATPSQWLSLLECIGVGVSGQILIFLWLERTR